MLHFHPIYEINQAVYLGYCCVVWKCCMNTDLEIASMHESIDVVDTQY